jgi:tetratricopeptide (TPR) repeat protein
MKKSGIIVLLLVGLWSFVTISCDPPAPIYEDELGLENGVDVDSQDDVLREIGDKIVADPNNPNLYYQRSKEFVRQNMLKEALNDIERCMLIDSTVAQFHFLKAEIHFKRMEPRLAKEAFEKTIELDETHTDAMLKLAEIYFLLRNHEEAMNLVNEVIAMDAYKPNAYFMKGYIFEEIGDTNKALSSYQTAVEVNPDYYEAYMSIANIYSVLNHKLTVDYYNNALQARPNSLEARYNLALFIQHNGLFNEAIDIYLEIIELASSMPGNIYLAQAYHNLGYIYMVEGEDIDKAIPYFEKAIENKPKYVEAIYNLGLAYEEIGRKEEAIKLYKRTLEINSGFDLAAQGLERLVDGRY